MIVLLLLLLVLAGLLAWFSASTARRIEKVLPPTGTWIDVDGERLHYRSLGDGPPIVFVHGLGGQMRNFDYLPLQELAQRHRLVLVDRPGAGHSPPRGDEVAGIGPQGRLIAAFIRAVRFEQPPLLVGHSLGGAISLAVALHDPDCIRGLALIAPLTHFNAAVPPAFRSLAIRHPTLRRLFARVLAVPNGILTGRRTLAVVFAPDTPPEDFGLRGGGLLSLRPGAFFGASTDMCAVERDLPAQQERYGELRLPVQVLFGERDNIVDLPTNGEALCRKVPQARLTLLPGGHMVPVIHPAQTAAWIEQAWQSSRP
jgi:pimeloyl-ACP methyl ester carboxylesterase